MRFTGKPFFDLGFTDNAHARVHRSEDRRVDSGGAAGYDNPGDWVCGKRVVHCFARFLVSFGSDRARVYDYQVSRFLYDECRTLLSEGSLNRIRFDAVDLAAEVYDMELS